MSNLFQSVPFAVVLLIIGFVFLVKGADAFVPIRHTTKNHRCLQSIFKIFQAG